MKPLATVVSLGCVKNLVDSETMAPQLVSLGYAMTPDPSQASLILVNTCGFLHSAVQEALDVILELSRHKTEGGCKHLIVAGCMVQRYGRKLPALLPEVDLFLGASHFHRLAEIIEARSGGGREKLFISAPRHLVTADAPRLRSTDFFSAYLKIAEGCSNRCAFCLIPHLRGPYRSRTIDDVLDEARGLAAEGVKEINLVAQDVTAFGSDRGDPRGLVRLLESLEDVNEVEWVRILYAYPDRVDGDLLRVMAQSKRIVPYLDIPVQHCVPHILRAMRGDEAATGVEEMIGFIRGSVPDISLRTSLIVGFPGESEKDFQELCRFVERVQFDHAGVFEFSAEEGARAAKFPSQVSDEVKAERRSILMDLQREVSRSRLERLVGRTIPVLVEGPHPETELLLIGRLPGQAPEVDGSVIITDGEAEIGRVMEARVTASHEYDVEAELLSPSCQSQDEFALRSESRGESQ